MLKYIIIGLIIFPIITLCDSGKKENISLPQEFIVNGELTLKPTNIKLNITFYYSWIGKV